MPEESRDSHAESTEKRTEAEEKALETVKDLEKELEKSMSLHEIEVRRDALTRDVLDGKYSGYGKDEIIRAILDGKYDKFDPTDFPNPKSVLPIIPAPTMPPMGPSGPSGPTKGGRGRKILRYTGIGALLLAGATVLTAIMSSVYQRSQDDDAPADPDLFESCKGSGIYHEHDGKVECHQFVGPTSPTPTPTPTTPTIPTPTPPIVTNPNPPNGPGTYTDPSAGAGGDVIVSDHDLMEDSMNHIYNHYPDLAKRIFSENKGFADRCLDNDPANNEFVQYELVNMKSGPNAGQYYFKIKWISDGQVDYIKPSVELSAGEFDLLAQTFNDMRSPRANAAAVYLSETRKKRKIESKISAPRRKGAYSTLIELEGALV